MGIGLSIDSREPRESERCHNHMNMWFKVRVRFVIYGTYPVKQIATQEMFPILLANSKACNPNFNRQGQYTEKQLTHDLGKENGSI